MERKEWRLAYTRTAEVEYLDMGKTVKVRDMRGNEMSMSLADFEDRYTRAEMDKDDRPSTQERLDLGQSKEGESAAADGDGKPPAES